MRAATKSTSCSSSARRRSTSVGRSSWKAFCRAASARSWRLLAWRSVFLAVRARYLVPLAAAINLSSIRFLSLELCVLLLVGGMAVGCLGGLVRGLANRLTNRCRPVYRILTLVFARHYTGSLASPTTHLEDLHATLRDRLEADQRAAPDHRVLPRRIRQASPMSSAAAALLFRERHHRRRGRTHANHGTARAVSVPKTTPTNSSAPSSRNSTSSPAFRPGPIPNTHTDSLPLRPSPRSPAIVRAGIRCGRPGELLVDAGAVAPIQLSDWSCPRLIAAGKAAPRWRRGASSVSDSGARRPGVAPAADAASVPFECVARRPSVPTADSERAGRARARTRRARCDDETSARPAVGRRVRADGGAGRRHQLDDKRRRPSTASRRRRHPRAQHRAQASVRDQRRLAGRRVAGPVHDVRDF